MKRLQPNGKFASSLVFVLCLDILTKIEKSYDWKWFQEELYQS